MARKLCLISLILLFLLATSCSASFSARTIHLRSRAEIDPLEPDARGATPPAGARVEYLVQLQPPVTRARVRAVETAVGLRFVENVKIPHHTLLAVLSSDVQLAALKAQRDVLYVADYHASFKYPASLERNLAHLTVIAGGQLAIVLHSVTSQAAAKEIVRAWSVAIAHDLAIDMRVRSVPRADRAYVDVPLKQYMQAVKWLAAQVGTLWIEPALPRRALANRATGIVESGVADPAYILAANGLEGGGQVIALADSGLDYDTCFINESPAPTSTFNTNASKVLVYEVDGGDTSDATGHGTAMAALMIGEPNTTNSEVRAASARDLIGGPAQYRGLAPAARIAFTDVEEGTSGFASFDIIEYVNRVYSNYSANVVVGGYGTATPVDWCAAPAVLATDPIRYTTNDQDMDNLLYITNDLVAVFAAGNFGQYNSTSGANAPGLQLISPAVAKNVITVGASQNNISSVIDYANVASDTSLAAAIAADDSQYGTNVLAAFSSKGPTPDGRFKPDVVAPGQGVFTSALGGAGSCDLQGVEGTSFAAALVGSAAAIVRQYLQSGYQVTGVPQLTNQINEPSAAVIKAALINSGVPLSGYSPAPGQWVGLNGQVPHPAYGFGRVQLSNVLYLTGSTPLGTYTIYEDAATGVGNGETQPYCFAVQGTAKTLKVTLVWTDPFGSVSSGYTLTNNLDLLVMDPNGRTYFANGLSTFDSINNVEQVAVANPVLGTWAAYVYGHYIEEAVTLNVSGVPRQSFAIVISGNVDNSDSCPTRCPHVCSNAGTCSSGVCTCSAGHFGVDCSLTACPNNCTAADGSVNGICDAITATCDCAPQFGGADCRLPANESAIQVVHHNRGLTNGQVAGIAVGTFLIGAILCGALGFIGAIQYLIWKRNKHKKLLEEGKGGSSGAEKGGE